MVHAAESFALAVLENLVHWQTVALPPSLVCVRVTIPRGLEQERIDDLDPSALAADDFMTTRALGNRWYARGRTAVLWVPSVVSPHESNVLFNQRHADLPDSRWTRRDRRPWIRASPAVEAGQEGPRTACSQFSWASRRRGFPRPGCRPAPRALNSVGGG